MLENMKDIEAYASKIFEGSPHMVCPLEHWITKKLESQFAENTLAYVSITGITLVQKEQGRLTY